MPKKIKPKWGWSGAGSFPPFPFSDDNFTAIAESLGVEKIEPEFQTRLVQAVHDYYSNHAILDNRPRPNNIIAALMVLQSETKAFANTLKNIDTATHDILLRTYINQKLLSPTNEPSNGCFKKTRPSESLEDIIERCRKDTKRINQAARKALIFMDEQGNDTGGPTTKRRAFRIMLFSLKEIFEVVTGEKATLPSINTSGKYFQFTKTFIHLGLANSEDPIPDSTLVAQIQKVLRS
jgi:hypothetical protein